MTSKEALRMLETRCRYFVTDNLEIEEIYEARSIIEKDLEILDLYKKFFKYSLTEIQGIKYLTLPNSDIRRPDSMLGITDEEYELLKEGVENDK